MVIKVSSAQPLVEEASSKPTTSDADVAQLPEAAIVPTETTVVTAINDMSIDGTYPGEFAHTFVSHLDLDVSHPDHHLDLFTADAFASVQIEDGRYAFADDFSSFIKDIHDDGFSDHKLGCNSVSTQSKFYAL